MFSLLDNFNRENMHGLFEKNIDPKQNKKFTTRKNLEDMLSTLHRSLYD